MAIRQKWCAGRADWSFIASQRLTTAGMVCNSDDVYRSVVVGIDLQHGCQLDQLGLVLIGVVVAEQQLGTRGYGRGPARRRRRSGRSDQPESSGLPSKAFAGSSMVTVLADRSSRRGACIYCVSDV